MFILDSIVLFINYFFQRNIRITCPCTEHPLTSHFYIEKVGFTRVYIFLLFLLQNIDCGYSLAEAVLTCTHNLCFGQNKKNIRNFHLKIIIFTAVKYFSILHGHVCVMILYSHFRVANLVEHSLHSFSQF